MAFPLPLLKPKAIDVSELPLFDFQKFFNKEEIGENKRLWQAYTDSPSELW